MVSLEERLRRIDSLPAVPSSVSSLIGLLGEPEPDTHAIEAGFLADPALCLSALRMANSAHFASVDKVDSVFEAAVRLGRRNLQKIVLLHFAASALSDAGDFYGLEAGEAWRAALAGGIAAEWIADRLDSVEAPVAFTASLLRDCGKLAMDHMFEQQIFSSLAGAAGRNQDQLSLEQEHLDLDHAEVGEALARCWNMPAPLPEAIRHHHNPPSDPPVPLIDVVYASDVVVSQLGIGVGVDGLRYTLQPEALDRIGFGREEMTSCMQHTVTRLDELASDDPLVD